MAHVCDPTLIFRQLFEKTSFTYTYLLADANTREAIIIDPVIETVDRDIKVINDLNLKVLYASNNSIKFFLIYT